MLYKWRCECGHWNELHIYGNGAQAKCEACLTDYAFVVGVHQVRLNNGSRRGIGE